MNQKILILYDYFDPAYKAGGPIRSLVNLVRLVEKELELFVLTSNRDHDGTILQVKPDEWLGYASGTQVKYLSKEKCSYSFIKKEIKEINPDLVYLNGIFSLPFVVYPLAVLRNRQNVKTVIAPRGMLQSQALSIKLGKKKIYLSILKTFFIHNNIQWHVTTEQEQTELLQFVQNPKQVSLIGNVPDFDQNINISTSLGRLRKIFGTVALISPMKNIHLILKALGEIKQELEYELYGPVKDEIYWQKCLELVKKLPVNIHFTYKGAIDPKSVGKAIAQFDFYIQPSKSENFGHSIFEAFNQGVPVIISDQTPWKNLKEKHAGWDVDLNKPNALKTAVEEAVNTKAESYSVLQYGARKIAEEYMEEHDFVSEYKKLFSTQ